MTLVEAAAFLRENGYSVRAPRASGVQRVSRTLTGKQHRDCVSHHRLAGYSRPVCVVSQQSADDVLGFARDVLAIGADAGDVLTASRIRDHGAQAVQAVAA